MKNKIKYILLPSILLFIIICAMAYPRKFNFGIDAYLNDTLANVVVTNKWFYFQPGDSIKYNGVTLTSGTGGGGGGDVFLANNNAFTGRNTVSDLWTFSDTMRANRLAIIDSLQVTSFVDLAGFMNVAGALDVSGAATFNFGIGVSGDATFNDDITTISDIFASDVNAGGFFIGDGSQVINLNADNLIQGTIDTARLPNDVAFQNQPNTFSLANLFNGIVTFASNIIVTGWTKLGSTSDEFKLVDLRGKTAATTGTTLSIAHGVSDWRSIIGFDFIIYEDSLNRKMKLGYSLTTGTTVGGTAYVDTTNFSYLTPTNSVNLVSDSVFVTIKRKNNWNP